MVSTAMKDGPPPVSLGGALRMKEAPVRGADARFALGPVSGPPVDLAMRLSAAISQEASNRKLIVVHDGDPTATYRLKGYISAVGDRAATQLVYVWDVYDQHGVRIHRISGDQPAPGTSGDPWNSVNGIAITAVARQTIDDLASWAGS